MPILIQCLSPWRKSLTSSPTYAIVPVMIYRITPRGDDRAELTLRSVRPAAERQPSDRRPAPGDLRLVQAFVNTFWDLERPGQDQFVSAADLAEWLVRRDLLEPGTRLTRADLQRALDLRQGLRALLFVNNSAATNPPAIERLNCARRGSGLFVQLDP
jgi:Putative stress-induced transcription regulator